MKLTTNHYSQYFEGKEELLHKLERLNEKMGDFRDAVKESSKEKPTVLTLIGSPRTGKTNISSALFDFFKKCNVDTVFLHEPAEVIQSRFVSDEEKAKAISDESKFNIGLRDFAFHETMKTFCQQQKPDLLIYDRGFINPYVWMQQHVDQGLLEKSQHSDEIKKLSLFNRNLNSFVFATYAPSEVSMQRDYQSALCLKPRKRINPENLDSLNIALAKSKNDIVKAGSKYFDIDCTKQTIIEASVQCANLFAEELKIL